MPETPPPPSDPAPEVLVEFPDNRLLIDLCGEFDRNLADIEQKLAVQLLRRGNQIAVMGAPESQKQAADILQSLYARLEAGRAVEPGDIDREFRMGSEEDGASLSTQLEMFKGGKVEIKTRKRLVEPRTDAQKTYVQVAVRK